MKLSEELQWRGFVNQTTFSSITDLDAEPRTFYWGVDPSAASMQIGNLAAAMMARVFIRHGYTPVLLVGGATGLIGDPDGKAQERDLKPIEEVTKNKVGIIAQYKRVFDGLEFKVVDNYDWFKDMNYLTFLRDVGKHAPIRQMLSRDFVQSRLGEDGAGISYAEFSYSLIQGYDFLHLFENHDVTLQLSGADQWGNSIAGVDLIRRKTGKSAHVWTTPLIINKATGIKFGKTEGGAVWLDPQMTSPYKFYQFWLNVDDEGVEDYLKIYTDIRKDELDSLMTEFKSEPGKRAAQRKLAEMVTTLVHSEEVTQSIQSVNNLLFGGGDYSSLTKLEIDVLSQELPCVKLSNTETIIDGLVASSLASSKSEARRFVSQGAVYLNGMQVSEDAVIANTTLVLDRYVVLRRGKNNNALVEIVS